VRVVIPPSALIGLSAIDSKRDPRFTALGVAIIRLMIGLFDPRIVVCRPRLAGFGGGFNGTVSAAVLAIIYLA